MKSGLKVIRIYKEYEGNPLLRGVTFSVVPGETICLLGSSGSGKSTLLRIIAGLEIADKGKILWDDQEIDQVPVHQRNFSLMFQDYALFPHLNVFENVAFGLRMRNQTSEEVEERVRNVLELVNLTTFAKRWVTDLSGGEQQRVALARALAPQPKLLMLDEPLGALDRALKEQLSYELRDVIHKTGIPAIYVTHDQQEAFTVADRLVILHEGRIIQEGLAEEVIRQPATLWLAGFLGFNNYLEGRIISVSPLKIQTQFGIFCSIEQNNHFRKGQLVVIVIKPDDVEVVLSNDHENTLRGIVTDVIFRGYEFLTKLAIDDQKTISFTSLKEFYPGTSLVIQIKKEMILCYGK